MNHFSRIAALLAALFLFAACGGEEGAIDSGMLTDLAAPDVIDVSGSDDRSLLNDIPTDPYVASSTRAVVVSAGLDVLNRPGGDLLTTLDSTTDYGTTRVLLVEEQLDEWLRVRLPSRPNHRSGWIAAADVRVEAVDLEVFVDLAAKTLSVRSAGEVLVRSPIAIGSDQNPTPIGTFYVTDKIETPNPDGAYGPYAIGLSGYSETLTEFAGGDGQIGIHGTNDPASIGMAVSHGCIRLPNEVVETLATMVPLGTPVHVV